MDSRNFPPVNNALLPDIYNKLDADLRERTRVINAQLDQRLVLQERVLRKYRRAAERFHEEETYRVRQDLAKINNRLPTVGNISNFCLGYYSRPRKIPRKVKGIPEEKTDMPFCERHYIHHLSTKKKYYKQATPTPPLPIVAKHDVVHTLLSPSALDVNGTVTDGDVIMRTDLDIEKTDVGTDANPETAPVKPMYKNAVLPASR